MESKSESHFMLFSLHKIFHLEFHILGWTSFTPFNTKWDLNNLNWFYSKLKRLGLHQLRLVIQLLHVNLGYVTKDVPSLCLFFLTLPPIPHEFIFTHLWNRNIFIAVGTVTLQNWGKIARHPLSMLLDTLLVSVNWLFTLQVVLYVL